MRHITIFLLLTGLLMALNPAQGARLYKWVDEDGAVSYHDRPPPDDAKYHVEEKNFQSRGGQNTSAEARKIASKYPVILYTVPRCASCDLARAHLEKRKIPFIEKDVGGDRELSAELKALSGSVSVPTITVGEKVITGFTKSWLDSELNQAGYKDPSAVKEEAEQ